MKRIFTWVLIFMVVYSVLGAVAYLTVPDLTIWYFSNCMRSHDLLCAVAADYLRYWCMWIIPLWIALTVLIERLVNRRDNVP